MMLQRYISQHWTEDHEMFSRWCFTGCWWVKTVSNWNQYRIQSSCRSDDASCQIFSCPALQKWVLNDNQLFALLRFLWIYTHFSIDRLFRTQWPFVLANLYADSTLVWFDGVEVLKANPRGYVELSKVSKMIALGKATNQLRNKPILPNGVDSSNLLAIGHENTITWLLFYSSSETW